MATEHKIKQAIHSDCLKLIENFSKRNNPEFEIFCLEWKLMYFHHIYSCQLNEIDMVQTITEAFRLCKRVLIQENPKLKKIGSMYLLYSLYYKQPTLLYVKIQVNLSTWRIIKQFIYSLANDNDCIQVRYIFWKLVSENAFRFVESDIYYGLEPFFNKEQDYTHHAISSEPEENIFNKELINLSDENEGFIKAFGLLEKSYNNMKNSLNANNQNEKNYIPIEPSNFIKEIQSEIFSIDEIFNAKSHTEEKNKNDMFKNIKERRTAIRKKAYSKHNQNPGTSKSFIQNDEKQYFVEEVSDNNSEGEDLPDPLRIEHIRKISKLNQIKILLQDPLPDEFQKELGDKND